MRNLILLCEHASNVVPDALNGLGIAACDLNRHIAYDIGARTVARSLSAAWGCPLVEARVSRLVIDLNRSADDPTLIMRIADGAIIPGNAGIDDAEKARRLDAYHRPFHEAVARAIAETDQPVLLSIHSFTPEFQGRKRHFELAVQWARDPRLPKPLMAGLEKAGFTVGDNVPYKALPGDSMDQHGNQNGLPHALLEIRQDLIASEEMAERLAQRLVAPIERAVRLCTSG